MGRGRISMELIKNEKKRQSMFKKRKEGLLKKVEQFKTLCGVDVCAVIHDPNSGEPETWPKDESQAHSVIQKFRETTVDRRPKIYGLEEYFKEKKKKVKAEKSRVRKQFMKIQNESTLLEIDSNILIRKLNAQVDACNRRINVLKGKKVAESPPNQIESSYPNPMMQQHNIMNSSIIDHNNPYQFVGQSSQPNSIVQWMGKEVAESLANQIESNNLDLMMMQQTIMMMMQQQQNMMNSSISDHNNSYQFVGQSSQPNSIQYGGEINYQVQNMTPCYYDGNYGQTMQQQQQYALSSSQNMVPQHQVFQYNYGLGDTNMQHQTQFFNYMNGRN